MPNISTNLPRILIFAAVALAHLLFILYFAITVNAVSLTPEQPATVMKLTDIVEDTPVAPPPPPAPEVEAPPNAVEAIAETMIETEEAPDQVVMAPGTLLISRAPAQYGETEEYLPAHKVSVPPVFSEREIRAALVYPPIALRSNIEGTVILELVIDRRGEIRQINVLKEDPQNRGFGDAAVAAFRGIHCTPAEANGAPVGVRYRYPVRFTIRG
jgi:protein TonB